jgi:hypothetical protein
MDWSDVADLGAVPDGELARRLGVTENAVRMARRRQQRRRTALPARWPRRVVDGDGDHCEVEPGNGKVWLRVGSGDDEREVLLTRTQACTVAAALVAAS